MPSELEGFIFSSFFGQNRILGCLGGILEASWVVLAKFLGLSWPPRRPQDEPKTRPRRLQDGPRRLQDGPRRIQDVPRWLKTAQDVPKRLPRCPRRLQDGPSCRFCKIFGPKWSHVEAHVGTKIEFRRYLMLKQPES